MPQYEDSRKRIEDLFVKNERALQRSFERVRRFLDKNPQQLRQVEVLLDQGREAEAIERLVNSFAAQVGVTLKASFLLAGRETTKYLEEVLNVLVVLDEAHPDVIRAINRQELALVQGLRDEQRLTLRRVLLDGRQRGVNPRQQARELGNALGLTPRQQGAVDNYRALLEAGDPRAKRRHLHDARVKDVSNLSPGQIDRMVDNYQARMIRHRATVVARTEALRATHEGAQAAYDQAVRDGVLRADDLGRKWHSASDARTRGHHASMHGQVRGTQEPFTSGLGNSLMYPGDIDAPAEDVIQCRCVVTTTFMTPES